MKSLWKMIASSIFLAVFTGSMFAQGGATGAISGVVQDPTGAVIANAKVSIKSEATGEVLRQATTDGSGLFSATLLPVGDYTVEVNAAGFPDTKFPGVVVRITETTRMTAVMKVSTVKEVVEVQSRVEQVNTTDATTGESLGAQTIADLPLATRNFQQLLDLSAGASASLNNAAAARPRRCAHRRQRRKRRQQQLSDRGGFGLRLLVRRTHVYPGPEPRRHPGIQGQHQPL